MIWDGLGVNYGLSNSSLWARDIPYFKYCGMNTVRINLPGAPQPWNSSANSPWRNCAIAFLAAKFYVSWGVTQTSGIITANNWQAYHDSVVSEAAYSQAQGIAYSDFQIGNELEGTLLNFMTALSQTAGLATAVMAKPHGLNTGDTVTIGGSAVPTGYAGSVTVSVTNITTFTYPVSSSLSSPVAVPTQAANVQSMTLPTLNNNLRQLALDVKAVYSHGPVSYGCFNAQVAGVSTYTDWIAHGLGGLDLTTIHPYGNVATSQGYSYSLEGGFNDVAEMVTAFGSSVYVSEFHINSSAANILLLTPEQQVTAMRGFVAQLERQVDKACVFRWSGENDGNNQWAMRNMDGSFNPVWDVLLGNDRRTFVP
jgi:hypothetical protein